MRKFGIILLITLVILEFACKDDNTSTNETNEQTPAVTAQTVENNETKTKATTLYAWVDKLRLRKAASSKSEIIAELKEGEALEFLNEKSDFTQKVNLRGTMYDEPWLKVKTSNGTTGWIYGGGVRPYKTAVDQSPSPYDACFKLRKDGSFEKYYDCLKRIEEKQLKKDLRYVERLDDGYRFRLLGGKEEEIKKETLTAGEDSDFVEYAYRYYIPKMGYFVVEVFYHEGGEYLLVNDKSGKKIKIWGYPKPAPDFKHMVVTSADLEAGFLSNGIQILGFTQNGLEIVFEQEISDYKPILPKWLDEKTIEISLLPASFDSERSPKTTVLKIGEDGKWVLEDD